MTADARKRAERCFAVARSTSFEGERNAAIGRGIKIAEDAGLSLDLFDIPGRTRERVRQPGPEEYVDSLFTRRPPPDYTNVSAAEAMRRFNEQMRATVDGMRSDPRYQRYAAEEARRQEATRAAFEDALKRATERQHKAAEAERQAKADRERREAERFAKVAEAVDAELWRRGWRVYRDADGTDGRRRWHVTTATGSAFENVDDERLCRMGGEAGITPDDLLPHLNGQDLRP